MHTAFMTSFFPSLKTKQLTETVHSITKNGVYNIMHTGMAETNKLYLQKVGST